MAEGDPIAVLESMKMESTITAPYAGEVAEVAVSPNAQVAAGAPIVRIRPVEVGAVTSSASGALDLSALEARAPEGTPICERVYGALRSYLLGYDLDPVTLKRLLVEQRRLGEVSPPADPGLLHCEDGLLDLFAEMGALYRPRTETDPEDALTATATQEYLLAFLQWLDADRAGLPDDYRQRLTAALAHYGVASLERSPELDGAVVWMFLSFARVRELVPVVVSILERRLRAGAVLRPIADDQMRARLARLAHSAQGRHQAVADLARDVAFHSFDEPLLEQLTATEYDETERLLDSLMGEPTGETRGDALTRIVQSPQPQRGALLRRWLTASDDDQRRTLLELYARRFYRTRELRDLRFEQRDEGSAQESAQESAHGEGRLLCVSDYERGNRSIRLVVAYSPLDELPEVACAVAATPRRRPDHPRRRRRHRHLASGRADADRCDGARRSRSCWPGATSAGPRGGST